MKNIINLLFAGVVLLLAGCEPEERLYNGPDIAYFDKKGILREEIADNNTRMTFRIVSPKAVNYDREYTVTKRFGSTMEEGKDYSFPQNRKAVIKAGEYWTDVDIEIVPESLSARVDTLAFGLDSKSGEIAQFDNELRLLISKRCEFVPELYAGAYRHKTHLFEYMPDHTVYMEVVKNADGSIANDRLLIKKPYGKSDILVKLDYSNPKKVTPVVEMQLGGSIDTYDPWLNPVTVPFYVHTTEQHTYPRVFEKRPNESFIYTCSAEFVIYMIAGVFFQDDDGTTIEGILGKGAVEENFKRLEPPYDTPKNAWTEAMNVEMQSLVGTVTYK